MAELGSAGSAFAKRKWDPLWLAKALADPARPVFLMGSTPPREGTTPEQALQICNKFVERSRCHPTDGFIVYDIQVSNSACRSRAPSTVPYSEISCWGERRTGVAP